MYDQKVWLFASKLVRWWVLCSWGRCLLAWLRLSRMKKSNKLSSPKLTTSLNQGLQYTWYISGLARCKSDSSAMNARFKGGGRRGIEWARERKKEVEREGESERERKRERSRAKWVERGSVTTTTT